MYEIIIKKKEWVDEITGQKWEIIDECPLSKKDMENSYYEDNKYEGVLKSVYGYTPKIVKKVETEQELLKQNVEDIDLPAIIKAINKL